MDNAPIITATVIDVPARAKTMAYCLVAYRHDSPTRHAFAAASLKELDAMQVVTVAMGFGNLYEAFYVHEGEDYLAVFTATRDKLIARANRTLAA